MLARHDGIDALCLGGVGEEAGELALGHRDELLGRLPEPLVGRGQRDRQALATLEPGARRAVEHELERRTHPRHQRLAHHPTVIHQVHVDDR